MIDFYLYTPIKLDVLKEDSNLTIDEDKKIISYSDSSAFYYNDFITILTPSNGGELFRYLKNVYNLMMYDDSTKDNFRELFEYLDSEEIDSEEIWRMLLEGCVRCSEQKFEF
jgi:hypothetical protein